MKQVSEMPTSVQFVAVFQRFGFVEVRSYEFSDSDRGESGFGSSGR